MQTDLPHATHTQDSSPSRDFRTYTRILLKYAPLIIIIAVITTGLAAIYSFAAPKIYRAQTLIRIEKGNMKMLNDLNSMMYGNQRDFDYIQTQIKLFTSRSLIKATLNELESRGTPFKPAGVTTDEHKINAFLSKMSIREVPHSQLLYLIIEDTNSLRAKKYCNTLAEQYIKMNINRKLEVTESVTEQIQTRIDAQQEKVVAAEQSLSDFKQKHNIDSYDFELTKERDTLQKLEQQLSEKEAAQYDADDLDENRRFLIEQQITELKKTIDQKKLLLSDLEKIGVEHRTLVEAKDAEQKQLTKLLNLKAESGIIKDFNPHNITIIDPAVEQDQPAKPKPVINILFGLLFGIVLGVGISFFLEYLDDTIKTPSDVEAFLNVPFLGLIPAMATGKKNIPIEHIVEQQPKGTVAESYRAIRTNILFSSGREVKTLVITSAGPGEGKTTTAVNIAQVMAKAGDRTLIIDSDMRRPRVHKVFDIENVTKGLSNFLVGNASIEETILPTGTETLSILPAGPIPPNPVELLNSPRLQELLKYASENYDRIIIDSPPVIAVTDAVILSRMTDGVIVATHGGHAHRDIVKRGIENLRTVGVHIFGVILNNVNIFRASYYDYYYYNYYRYAYGYGYGYRTRPDTAKGKEKEARKTPQKKTVKKVSDNEL